MGNIPLWLCIPFAGLLLCIAIFPLVKGEWWDKNKGWAVLIWSLLFIIPFAVKYGAGETAETVQPAMLTLVGLADKYKSYPKELSGGEQQRVAMARALVNNPEIILADEPTGNLDPKNSEDIMELLDDINKRGTTVVVVTHNKDIVNEMRKRVITLKKGVVISDEKQGGYIDED